MPDRIAPRRWLAALLSLAMPGWGHAYAGGWQRGLVILLAFTFGLQPLLAAWLLHSPRSGLVAGLVLAPLALIAVAIDAAALARRAAPRNASAARVVAVCTGFFLAGMVLDTAGAYLRAPHVAQTYHVPSPAMLPTLLIGDHLEGADLYVNGRLATGPGAGATFTDPRGETYEVRDESLGDHRYRVLDHPRRGGRPFGPFVVEPDRYFVAGDNRENSNDSRFWGTVHRDDVVGGMAGIYWSWNFTGPHSQLLDPRHVWTLLRERTRWERIGTRID